MGDTDTAAAIYYYIYKYQCEKHIQYNNLLDKGQLLTYLYPVNTACIRYLNLKYDYITM